MISSNEIINSVIQVLELERISGVDEMLNIRRGEPEKQGHKVSSDNVGKEVRQPESEGSSKKNRGGVSLSEVKEKAAACKLCRLAKTRLNVVFGEGSPHADLMFVGEAPGRDEDAQARPFIGRAGKLLSKIIEAMGLKREDVFIANILKCRPPENRNPLPTEIVQCTPFLLKQIELIKPEVICALGKFASQTLLDTDTPISRLRGEFFDYHGVKLMPTYHPAYLLRNPKEKGTVWKDMQLIAKEMGIRIPEKNMTA